MRITPKNLLRLARETVQKRTLADPGLVAAYLAGSLCGSDPFMGGTADIDIFFVHADQPGITREIVALTPEIHLDMVHRPRSDYEKPRELRTHPWLGPELYDPLPLYVNRHFFEFVQAGVRADYFDPANVLARARKFAEAARKAMGDLSAPQNPDLFPAGLLAWIEAVGMAANALAALNGAPLAERRLLLQFPARAEAAGAPHLSARLEDLLGSGRTDPALLAGFLPAWETDFLEAARRPGVDESIAAPRLAYYRQSMQSMLESGSPYACLWPLLHTWSRAAAVLPPERLSAWRAASETLGLAGESFNGRIGQLDTFLDDVEDILDAYAASQGV